MGWIGELATASMACPRNRTTLQRYSEMKFAWKYLAHVLHSGSEREAKVGNCRADIFFQCRYFAPMSPLGAHTYLSWWRQPNSQIQIPINCTEKKIKSSKQQARLLQALHVEAIQPSDKVKLLELLVKMKFAQDHCYDLAELAVELWRLEIVAWIFQCGLSSNSYVILDPKNL